MSNVIDFPSIKREIPPQYSESNRYKPTGTQKTPRKQRPTVSRLQYYSRSGQWRASNVCLTEKPLLATSYNWWIFLQIINGKVVFNNYRYSVSTSKHQSNVRGWLSANGIEIDLFIECPRGLQQLDDSIPYYEKLIEGVQREINAPRTQAAKNAKRRATIAKYRLKIKAIKNLLKG